MSYINIHTPVLLNESLELLDPKPNENFIDCTCGEATFAGSLLRKNAPNGRVVLIDLNKKVLEVSKERLKEFSNRIFLFNKNFGNIKNIYSDIKNIEKDFQVSGIYADLGISRFLLDQGKRGFSFKKDEVLDMRYGENGLPVWQIINNYSKDNLEKVIKDFGQEKHFKLITKLVIEWRKKNKIVTVFDLLGAIEPVSRFYRHEKIHFATRTFQALRIEANCELDNLTKLLNDGFSLLEKGGRLVVVSYHSLEDRIVKFCFRGLLVASKCQILTKKPIVSSQDEKANNPSSRSAKLRAIVKIV